MRLARAALLSLLLPVVPAFAGDFPCPPGWAHVAEDCDPAECLAPMGKAVIQLDTRVSVAGVPLDEAMQGYEKIVAADGTPLHEMIAESAPELAGLTGLRRDYAGTARARNLRIALVLLRRDGEDVLLRAVWDADGGFILEHMIDTAISAWDPH